MIVTQQYQGGDLIIPRQQLERLGVAVGDVVEIGKVVTKKPNHTRPNHEQLRLLLQTWQEEWSDVDWDLFEQDREAMWLCTIQGITRVVRL